MAVTTDPMVLPEPLLLLPPCRVAAEQRVQWPSQQWGCQCWM